MDKAELFIVLWFWLGTVLLVIVVEFVVELVVELVVVFVVEFVTFGTAGTTGTGQRLV